MRTTPRIEGGGRGGWEPKQVYEKNLSAISGYDVISSLSQGIDWKGMQDLFVQIAPKSAGLSLVNLKTWNDRNTNNADTKLSKESPFKNITRQLPRVPENNSGKLKERKKRNR